MIKYFIEFKNAFGNKSFLNLYIFRIFNNISIFFKNKSFNKIINCSLFPIYSSLRKLDKNITIITNFYTIISINLAFQMVSQHNLSLIFSHLSLPHEQTPYHRIMIFNQFSISLFHVSHH